MPKMYYLEGEGAPGHYKTNVDYEICEATLTVTARR